MKKSDGTWLQNKLQTVLRSMQTHTPSFFYRFPDTKAARNFLPVQPGDFMLLLPYHPALLIECKSTAGDTPFRELLDPGQLGKHRLWLRAKHCTGFLYGQEGTEMLQWYCGPDVLRVAGTRGRLSPSWTGQVSTLPYFMTQVFSHV